MTELEQKVIEAALRKMFARGHFSICTIDQCATVLGVPTGGKTYDMLHALHCVDFADMDRDLAQAVPGMIAEVLRGVSFDVGDMMRPRPVAAADVVEPEAQPRRGLLELFRK